MIWRAPIVNPGAIVAVDFRVGADAEFGGDFSYILVRELSTIRAT